MESLVEVSKLRFWRGLDLDWRGGREFTFKKEEEEEEEEEGVSVDRAASENRLQMLPPPLAMCTLHIGQCDTPID